MWTLKAKTIADPIGNEEQLMNVKRKGALVDLRPGPHEVVQIAKGGVLVPMRSAGSRTNRERAFSEFGNFATDPEGRSIPGNRGEEWPAALRDAAVWSEEPPVFPWADGTCAAEPEPGSNLKLDCASGFGTAVFVTGAFGLAAAGEAVRALVSRT